MKRSGDFDQRYPSREDNDHVQLLHERESAVGLLFDDDGRSEGAHHSPGKQAQRGRRVRPRGSQQVLLGAVLRGTGRQQGFRRVLFAVVADRDSSRAARAAVEHGDHGCYLRVPSRRSDWVDPALQESRSLRFLLHAVRSKHPIELFSREEPEKASLLRRTKSGNSRMQIDGSFGNGWICDVCHSRNNAEVYVCAVCHQPRYAATRPSYEGNYALDGRSRQHSSTKNRSRHTGKSMRRDAHRRSHRDREQPVVVPLRDES